MRESPDVALEKRHPMAAYAATWCSIPDYPGAGWKRIATAIADHNASQSAFEARNEPRQISIRT